MKKILFSAIFLFVGQAGFMQTPEQEDYIERHKKLAMEEMERTGIPASIKLAQGILESSWGKSELAVKGNNHFGIKCGNNWKGKTIYKKDDDRDKSGRIVPSCFRVYSNAEDSYKAHSDFLLDPQKEYRYGHLFKLNPTDYKKWAKGLKASGYATSSTYADNLINLIESYGLYNYDQPIWEDLIVFKEETNWTTLLNNEVRYTFSNGKETVREIARRVNVPARKLVSYNEYITYKDQVVGEEEMIYLQPKRSNYRGKKTWHRVVDNETMFQISQQYGISLKKLYRRNLMEVGMEPQNNAQIKIRGWKVMERPVLTVSGYMAEENKIAFPHINDEKKSDGKTFDPFGKKQERSTNPNKEADIEFAFPEAIQGNINKKRKTSIREN